MLQIEGAILDIAVTGASGLIGTAVSTALADEGHRVVRLARGAGAAATDTLRWDPLAGTIDAAGLEGIDAVIHLAGEGIAERRWSDDQKRRILESRTMGTSLLADALAHLRNPPAVMLSASAVGWYGDRGDTVLTESSAPGTGFLSDVCSAWENATRPAEEAGVRVTHLRTGMVLSRDGGALAKMRPLFRLGLGGPFGNGRQIWSWISIHDHVAAMLYLLGHDLRGGVNLTAPHPVSSSEFAHVLGRVVHRPALLRVPKIGPSLLLGRELATNLLYASSDVRPERLVEDGFLFDHPDLATALRAICAAK